MSKFIEAFQELRRWTSYWYHRLWSLRYCKKHKLTRTLMLEVDPEHHSLTGVTGKREPKRFCIMCVAESMVQPIRRRVVEA